MKIIIMSDIHGSLNSAQKLQDLYQKINPELIYLLGDINYHGPRNPLPDTYNPKEVIKILNELKDKIVCVRGNCDADVESMVLNFDLMDYLKLREFNNHKIWLSHGHRFNEQNLPKDIKDNDIFMYGHTHIPVCKYENNHYIFNPGSITLPKENHPRTYGILDDNSLNIYTIDDELYMSIKLA